MSKCENHISIWDKVTTAPNFKSLEGDLKTDVLIIGGGICGIMTALCLEEQGINYVLVEKNKICTGVTNCTTAKITAQHGFIYQKLVKQFGEVQARLYYNANTRAIEKYRQLAEKFDCELKTTDNVVYTLDSTKLANEIQALNKMHVAYKRENELEIPVKIFGAIRFENQAQFNPLKLLYGVSSELNIYENTFITALDGTNAYTADGMEIRADKVIIATHFPYISRHGTYPLRLYQHRSYVIALENAQRLDAMYVDESGTGLSFRNYDKYLLLGGGGHRTGKAGGCWSELERFIKNSYPDAIEVCRFATQDCMSLDTVPYIGRFSKGTPNVFVATGFNKWGMTTSMLAGEVLCDMVLGRSNALEWLFSPSRSLLKPQLAVNAFETTKSLINLKPKRCTHLGCALEWNKEEQSWDCTCHGSRFDAFGRVTDNPAKRNLQQ